MLIVGLVVAIACLPVLKSVRAVLDRGVARSTVTLDGLRGATFHRSDNSCTGAAEYEAFHDGTGVIVSDMTGNRLATAQFGPGAFHGDVETYSSGTFHESLCVFLFILKLPDRDIYRFEFAGECFLVDRNHYRLYRGAPFNYPYLERDVGANPYESLFRKCNAG